MLTFPFRLLSTIAFALFCYSKWVRRAVAGVAVSCVIVAAQHPGAFEALGTAKQHGSLLSALVSLSGN